MPVLRRPGPTQVPNASDAPHHLSRLWLDRSASTGWSLWADVFPREEGVVFLHQPIDHAERSALVGAALGTLRTEVEVGWKCDPQCLHDHLAVRLAECRWEDVVGDVEVVC